MASRHGQLIKITKSVRNCPHWNTDKSYQGRLLSELGPYIWVCPRGSAVPCPLNLNPHNLPFVIETLTLSQIPDSAFKLSYPFGKARKEF